MPSVELSAAIAAMTATKEAIDALLTAVEPRLTAIEDRLRLAAGAIPYWFVADENGQTPQTIPTGVATKNTSMIQKDGTVGPGAFSAGRFTVTDGTKGLWLFFARLNILNETSEYIELQRNGVNWTTVQLTLSSGTANQIASTSPVPLGTSGDYVEFFHKHAAGADRVTENSQVIGVRLS